MVFVYILTLHIYISTFSHYPSSLSFPPSLSFFPASSPRLPSHISSLPISPITARRYGGALNLLQQVWAEPDCQTLIFGAFLTENQDYRENCLDEFTGVPHNHRYNGSKIERWNAVLNAHRLGCVPTLVCISAGLTYWLPKKLSKRCSTTFWLYLTPAYQYIIKCNRLTGEHDAIAYNTYYNDVSSVLLQ